MACYKQAADLGDISALNNIGLMLEFGYDDVMPSQSEALIHYKEAHKMGNSDATINIGLHYLKNGDVKMAKALLINAYQNKNQRALDVMLSYGICQNKGEVEGVAISFNMEEVSGEYAGIGLKKTDQIEEMMSSIGLGTHSRKEMSSQHRKI